MNASTTPAVFLRDKKACSWIRDYVTHFANPVRIKILCQLMQGRACVSELIEATDERQSTVSQQLQHLRLAGLVEREGEGTRHYYRIADPSVPETMRFLAKVARRDSGASKHPKS